jgi:hypothetical protein
MFNHDLTENGSKRVRQRGRQLDAPKTQDEMWTRAC